MAPDDEISKLLRMKTLKAQKTEIETYSLRKLRYMCKFLGLSLGAKSDMVGRIYAHFVQRARAKF